MLGQGGILTRTEYNMAKKRKRVLIVGSNQRSHALAEKIVNENKYDFIGFVDTPERIAVSAVEPVACSLYELEEHLKEKEIDEVFITLPIRAFYDKISDLIETCKKIDVKAKIVSDLFELDYEHSVTVQPVRQNIFRNKLTALSNKILLFLKKDRHPQILRVLIIGLNLRSLSLAESIRKGETGYEFAGFVDNQTDEMFFSFPIQCQLDNLEDYISKNPVDEVIVTLPIRSFYDQIKAVIDVCREQGVSVRLIDDFFSKSTEIPKYINLDASNHLVDCKISNRSLLQYDIKWLIDISSSFCLILFFLPVFLIISIVVYYDDGSPVFFYQERIGLNKRRFNIWKFRTMVRDAEKRQAELEARNEVKGAAFKITDDPRITNIGRWLRKTSLDELPQLFNVLKGDMSLVGPRPLPVRDFERFYRNAHRRRFSVKPGITGLWQVSGRSDNISFDKWMDLDLYYVDKWNLLVDIKILLKTIPAVFLCKGAK
jgi:exopolysaccharide biosynthesis polyprenyl glycosylphosphotransferase